MLVEQTEFTAWADYYASAPRDFAAKYGVRVAYNPLAWISMAPRTGSWFFNRINGLGLEAPATEQALDEAIGILTSAGCTEYVVPLSPAARPTELAGWLKARGLRYRNNWAKMYRGNEPAPPSHTDLRIERVGEQWAGAFGELVRECFEMPAALLPFMGCHVGRPGWFHYLGFDGGRPVSAAAMFMSGESAWLGFAGTLASHRGRGAQGALFARRIADGLEAGCKWFVTETGEDTPDAPNPSYRNMLRAGFQLAYMRPNYLYSGQLT